MVASRSSCPLSDQPLFKGINRGSNKLSSISLITRSASHPEGALCRFVLLRMTAAASLRFRIPVLVSRPLRSPTSLIDSFALTRVVLAKTGAQDWDCRLLNPSVPPMAPKSTFRAAWNAAVASVSGFRGAPMFPYLVHPAHLSLELH